RARRQQQKEQSGYRRNDDARDEPQPARHDVGTGDRRDAFLCDADEHPRSSPQHPADDVPYRRAEHGTDDDPRRSLVGHERARHLVTERSEQNDDHETDELNEHDGAASWPLAILRGAHTDSLTEGEKKNATVGTAAVRAARSVVRR